MTTDDHGHTHTDSIESQQSVRVMRFEELSSRHDSDLIVTKAARTILGVEENELRTYLVLVDHPGSTTSEISAILDTAYTSVHQRLTKLREKGLVSRQRVIADSEGGGHKYEYEAQSLAETHHLLREGMAEWSEAIETQISALQNPSR